MCKLSGSYQHHLSGTFLKNDGVSPSELPTALIISAAAYVCVQTTSKVAYPLKVKINDRRPALLSAKDRQKAADEKAGIRNRFLVHLSQILIALFTERIGIQVDHMAVNKIVGWQVLQKPVDLSVSDVSGQSQKDIEQPEGTNT